MQAACIPVLALVVLLIYSVATKSLEEDFYLRSSVNMSRAVTANESTRVTKHSGKFATTREQTDNSVLFASTYEDNSVDGELEESERISVSNKTSPSHNVSRFNLSEALNEDVAFQDAFCPNTCAANYEIIRKSCARTWPACSRCKCDKVCVKYGDCCNVIQPDTRNEHSHNYKQSTEMDEKFDNTFFTNSTISSMGELQLGNETNLNTLVLFSSSTEFKSVTVCEELVIDRNYTANCGERNDSCDQIFEKTCSTGKVVVKTKYKCFAVNESHSIYIIATCPSLVTTEADSPMKNIPRSQKEIDGSNSSVFNGSQTKNFSIVNEVNKALCERCYDDSDNISLITSHRTGDTYCNKHCLECHENRVADCNDTEWSKQRKCRAERVEGEDLYTADKQYYVKKSPAKLNKINKINAKYVERNRKLKSSASYSPISLDAGDSNKRKSGARNLNRRTKMYKTRCFYEHVIPIGVKVRNCDSRLTSRVVDECDREAARQVFKELANESLMLQLEDLCHSYWAPVVTQKVVYKNIFCFICQGLVPSSCYLYRQRTGSERNIEKIKHVNLGTLTRISKDNRRPEKEVHILKKSDSLECPKGYWTDPVMKRCRKMHCAPSRVLSEDQELCLMPQAKSENTSNKIKPNNTNETWETSSSKDTKAIYILNLVWTLLTDGRFSETNHSLEMGVADTTMKRMKFQPVAGNKRVRNRRKSDMLHRQETTHDHHLAKAKRTTPSQSRTRESNPKIRHQSQILNMQTDVRRPVSEGNETIRQLLLYDNVDGDDNDDDDDDDDDDAVPFTYQSSQTKFTSAEKSDLFRTGHSSRTSTACKNEWLDILCDDSTEEIPAISKNIVKEERAFQGTLNILLAKGRSMSREIGEALNGGKKDIRTLEFSKSIQEYIQLTMNVLNVTQYAFLRSNMTGDPQRKETYSVPILSEKFSKTYQINTVLCFITSLKEMERLEKGLLLHFNGYKTLSNNVSSSIDMLMSKPNATHNYKEYMLYSDSKAKPKPLKSITPTESLSHYCAFAHQKPMVSSTTDCNIFNFDLTTSNCPYVTFDADEVDFNGSIRDFPRLIFQGNSSNLTLDRFNYTVGVNGSINVCVHILKNLLAQEANASSALSMSLADRIENILSLVSLAVSMISLILLFLTYCLFPSLRSLPGKNNMHLVAWLFMAQFQLLLEPFWRPYPRVCVVMGALLHISWLNVIAWTAACSFHMCHIFAMNRGAAPVHPSSHRYYLIRYTAASLIFSLSIVAVVILVNGVTSHGTHLGYGAAGICYLSFTFLVLTAFVLPLAAVLTTNLVMFAITVVSIARVEEVQRKAGRERHNARVYVCLSSLTGLCWTLALLAEIPGAPRVLRSVSIVVNGSQGLMLFLSYAWNRRVARMWANLLGVARESSFFMTSKTKTRGGSAASSTTSRLRGKGVAWRRALISGGSPQTASSSL